MLTNLLISEIQAAKHESEVLRCAKLELQEQIEVLKHNFARDEKKTADTGKEQRKPAND